MVEEWGEKKVTTSWVKQLGRERRGLGEGELPLRAGGGGGGESGKEQEEEEEQGHHHAGCQRATAWAQDPPQGPSAPGFAGSSGQGRRGHTTFFRSQPTY